jgi:hypothetical protein
MVDAIRQVLAEAGFVEGRNQFRITGAARVQIETQARGT